MITGYDIPPAADTTCPAYKKVVRQVENTFGGISYPVIISIHISFLSDVYKRQHIRRMTPEVFLEHVTPYIRQTVKRQDIDLPLLASVL